MPVSPKKLRLSKWTAVQPQHREKHFLVVEVVEPETEGGAITDIVLEAVHSRRRQTLPWRALDDAAQWRQGWC
ncbi:MAG: TIGR02450 family Trp-rich protein [Sphingomonadaceae bacterium]